MKITQELREYAAQKGLSDQDAISKGLEEKAKEFVLSGGEIYKEV
jgi:phosphomethylpyrimidine synthase